MSTTPPEVCYSDHEEDIRTKGSCDLCGSTEQDQPGPVQPHLSDLPIFGWAWAGDAEDVES